jgi:hypothetical protein
VLSSRGGTSKAAATIKSIAKALPAMNRFSRTIRMTSSANVITIATSTTFHMFPRAIQNNVASSAPAIPIAMPTRDENARLSNRTSISISPSKHAIESASRISCVE